MHVYILLSFILERNVFCTGVKVVDHTFAAGWKVYRRSMINGSSTTGHYCSDSPKNVTAQMSNLGLVPPSYEKPENVKLTPFASFPVSFDAREKFGKLCPQISQVFNQGRCKSGWAIAIASVIGDRLCIKTRGQENKLLSAQNLLSCCEECCGCNGGIILNAWHWVLKNGLVTGSPYKNNQSCMPYKIPPAHPKKYKFSGYGGDWATANLALPHCYHTCKDSTVRKVTKILGYELWSITNEVSIMNQLMMYGPLQASMHMYSDFRYYSEGVYTHTTGKFEGEHAVKLIGWGVWKNIEYWLAINSFGNTSWGIKGSFMIPRNRIDNTEFGYALVSPILMENKASKIKHFKQKRKIVFIIIFLLLMA